MIVVVIGFNSFNFFNNIYIFSYFIECIVVLIIDRFVGVVKEVVVIYINKKLSCCRVWILGMCYCDCIYFVCYVVVCFVFNRVFCVFLIYIWCKIIILDYEVVDYMVKNSVIKKIVFNVRNEVSYCFRCFIFKKF